jgi:taurine dioxygenase
MPLDFNSLTVTPLSLSVGAEISGVNLADLSDEQFAEIREASNQFGVIFFRDQDLTPEQQLAFARRWGPINVNRFFTPVEGYPEIAEVRKEPDQKMNIGNKWHTDHSYDEIPAFGSILYAKEVPEIGGDTMFAGMAAAYEGLSEGFKQMLSGLKAAHSSRHIFGANKSRISQVAELGTRIRNPELATQDSVHPIVLTHPRTGRKGIYVNPEFTTHIDGWTAAESEPLLNAIYQHVMRPEYQCRFHWTKGALAVWDNLATWHLAVNDYHGSRRLMHRVTIEGIPL